MTIAGMATFSINDISMSWDERRERVEKPCVECKKPTKGRMVNGGGVKRPAHLACAMNRTTNKAMQVYGRER